MKTVVLIFFLMLGSCISSSAQVVIDTLAIQSELHAIFERDQKTRTSGDSAAFMHYIDSCNLVQVKLLLDKYGWMGRSMIGDKANSALFLVIQHADLETQLMYFPLLQKSAEIGESKFSNAALMQDRILMRQGKKQIYGSQVLNNKATGKPEFYPIEDEKDVNVRRGRIGMSTLEEYAKLFGIEYRLPKE
ncbi:MAG: hypothetical protein IPK10_16005 [Bacteroidetes bacterium]|nr:hypothetical protein [Bacteroidota bacterium]